MLHRSKDRRREATLMPLESTHLGGLDEDGQGEDPVQEGGYCNGRLWDCPKPTHGRPRGEVLLEGRNC